MSKECAHNHHCVVKKEDGNLRDLPVKIDLLIGKINDISLKTEEILSLLGRSTYPGIVITCMSSIIEPKLSYYCSEIKRPGKNPFMITGQCTHIDLDVADIMALYRSLEAINIMPEKDKGISICLSNEALIDGLETVRDPFKSIGSPQASEKFEGLLGLLEKLPYAVYHVTPQDNLAMKRLQESINKFVGECIGEINDCNCTSRRDNSGD